jgi:uncharacterized protein
MQKTPRDFSSIRGTSSNVFIYYAATFGLAWAVWIPILLSARGLIGLHIPLTFALLAGLAPIGTGVWLTWREQGIGGLKDLVTRCLMMRARWPLYLAAIGLPALNIILPLMLNPGTMIPPVTKWLPIYLTQIPIITGMAIFEEAGWRGYASPRLQHKFGKYPASLLMGCLWAIWHWPYWLTPGLGFITDMSLEKSLVALAFTLIGTAAFETQLTWLFNKARGSLFFACLFHSAYNSLWLALIAGKPNNQLNTTWLGPVVSASIALVLFLIDTRGKPRPPNPDSGLR